MTELSQPATTSHEHYRTRRALMLMAALGIVYGDIGTSPLYAFKVALEAAGWVAGGAPPDLVLGVLSLIFWSLVITISVKYIGFVLRADNEGEGGILALTGLLCRDRMTGMVLVLGLFGSALLYGDGVITPAISVLSAFEGLETAAPQLQHFVMPLTVIVLIGFFCIQCRGTARIAKLFGPVMLTWFATIAVLGVIAIAHHPHVLVALNPIYAVDFVTKSNGTALAVCGAVFLAVTGGEALYADMGHIGRIPIARAWGMLVLPALCLNYFGQGAVVLDSQTLLDNPFFSLAPSFLVIPLVILSAMATVIASQAVVTGVFSLTKQAVQLGSLPRIRIVQTSGAELDAGDRDRSVDHPVQEFGQSGCRLWRCGKCYHDHHHDPALPDDEAGLALEGVARLAGRGRVSGRRRIFPDRQSDQGCRGRLAALGNGWRCLLDDAHLDKRC
jgi:KUP system potassium uptake protein